MRHGYNKKEQWTIRCQAAKAVHHLPSSSSGVFPFGPLPLFFSCLDWDVLKKFVAPEKVFSPSVAPNKITSINMYIIRLKLTVYLIDLPHRQGSSTGCSSLNLCWFPPWPDPRVCGEDSKTRTLGQHHLLCQNKRKKWWQTASENIWCCLHVHMNIS